MKATKILTEEISDLTVASLPTRPTADKMIGGRGFSSKEMRAAFDKLPLHIIERFNCLIEDIETLGEDSLAGAVKTGITEDHTLSLLFEDISSGAFSSYLSVLGKPLSILLAELISRIEVLERGEEA